MRTLIVAACALVTVALPDAAWATEWGVDAAKSWLGFTGVMAKAPFNGRFGHWQADISFDPAQPEAGHAVVKVDMSSAATGDRQKDTALPQRDWFDAKSFPQAVFEAQSFRPRGGAAYDAIGTLTIRGVKKEVAMPLSIEVNGSSLHAKGGLDLARTDFGIGQGEWTSPQWVAFEVAVAFDVTAARKE